MQRAEVLSGVRQRSHARADGHDDNVDVLQAVASR
jgi:hypothetical protein